MNSIHLTSSMFSTDAMQAVFTPRATVQRMLDFEAALARAEAAHRVIPAAAAQPIAQHCNAARIDLEDLTEAAGAAGNLAIPLVKQLTRRVAQADAEAAKYVHWGATSQDVIDTGLVLQLRDALDLIDADLAQLCDTLALGAEIGRMAAHELVERACRSASESGRHLREVLKQEPQIGAHLSEADIERLLDPERHTGAAAAFVERVLETHSQQRQQDRRIAGNSHQE